MTKKNIITTVLICASFTYGKKTYASPFDSTSRFNLHFQLTTIDQWHGSFTSPYQGLHSLSPNPETDLSITTTLFLGARLWKNAEAYFNPEVGGGQGFSGASGIAGFTNGEIYRVGDPTPSVYIGRIYLAQYFPLKGSKNTFLDDGQNQVKDSVPDKCFKIIAGKYCLADFFDNNAYSHDPRTQFINWSTMSNGAWDYPANTRGYTWSALVGYQNKRFSAQACAALEPTYANGPDLDWNVDKTIGLTGEISYTINRKRSRKIDTSKVKIEHALNVRSCWPVEYYLDEKFPMNFHLLFYNNITRAGNYEQTIANYKAGLADTLNVNSPSAYNGNKKYGFGLSFDMALSNHVGVFARIGWNDGHTATWAYTEIDETALLGISFSNIFPKKYNNTLGVCAVINGISQEHQDFLNAGGYGFIIGDGKLPDYGPEIIGEIYYNFQLTHNLALAVDYQYVQNPAYNLDRGPVPAIISGRVHITF
jgi:high affinity Mn2+ porin